MEWYQDLCNVLSHRHGDRVWRSLKSPLSPSLQQVLSARVPCIIYMFMIS